MYYEACNLLSGELQHLFQTKEIPFVISMEQALIKAANKVVFQSELKKIGESCFKYDLDMSEHTASTSSWNYQENLTRRKKCHSNTHNMWCHG